MRTSIASQSIIRYLTNDLTQEEKEFFEAWLTESDDHKEEFASVALLWEELGKGTLPAPVPVDDAWACLLQTIDREADGINTLETSPKSPTVSSNTQFGGTTERSGPPLSLHAIHRPWYNRYTFWAAAAVIVIAGTALAAVLLLRDARRHDTVAVSAVHEVFTKNGQRLTVLFPDGSAAYLNAGSMLRYPDAFGDNERRIEMEGEAYFTIAPDTRRPFRIMTGAASTEVLGTEFNLRYRDSLYILTVAKGFVQSSDRTSAFRLKKGDRIVYDAVRSSFSPVQKANPEFSFAWRENKLAFDHATLEQTMKELELWYGVRVVFTNPSATRKTLSAVFRTESLDEILSNIAFALNVSIVRKGNTVHVQ